MHPLTCFPHGITHSCSQDWHPCEQAHSHHTFGALPPCPGTQYCLSKIALLRLDSRRQERSQVGSLESKLQQQLHSSCAGTITGPTPTPSSKDLQGQGRVQDAAQD